MTWLIVGIVVALLVAGYSLLARKFVRIIKPIFETSPTLIPAYAEPDSDAELLKIPTSNGLTLSACLYRRDESESRGIIIFCPEFGATKWSWRNYCRRLWETGYDILSFDFRNQGESDSQDGYQELHWLTDYEIEDVKAVIDFVKSHPDLCERPIGLMGVSRGGSAALAAGAESPDVELICVDSAFPTEPMMMFYVERWVSLYAAERIHQILPLWHARFIVKLAKWSSQWSNGCKYAEVLPRLKRMARHKRVLLIAGSRDSFVHPDVTHTLQDSLGESCEELWMVHGAKHNMARTIDPERYQERTLAFFSAMAPVHEAQAEAAVQEATA
jgi:dienelactone hydrolase